MNIESEREAFEARFSKVYGLDFDEETEEYKDPGDQALWYGWQARAALTASAPNHSEQVRQMVPEGWKLVPVEPQGRQQFNAAFNLCGEFGDVFVRTNEKFAMAVYREMVKAAPSPASQKEQGE